MRTPRSSNSDGRTPVVLNALRPSGPSLLLSFKPGAAVPSTLSPLPHQMMYQMTLPPSTLSPLTSSPKSSPTSPPPPSSPSP
mmetsp:Transcript_19368/g.35974  ORF Transcript_19368/g.35974 Transcript_19368/m.35974 type:complete len:82 (-) Transcript_19368:493-738(-)